MQIAFCRAWYLLYLAEDHCSDHLIKGIQTLVQWWSYIWLITFFSFLRIECGTFLFNFGYFEASCSYYTIHSFHSYSCSLLVLVVHSRYIINFLCSFLGLYQGWLTNWYSNRELNDLLSELWFKSYYVMDKREPLIWSLILKVYLTCSSRFLILEFMRGIFCIANINSLVR
jgi:hypothetical protein